jgi:ribosomal protein S18 acetylase RimI-like enzyme
MTRETNLDAHLFLKRQGFTAVEIVGGYYVDTPEDAYRFSYLLDD